MENKLVHSSFPENTSLWHSTLPVYLILVAGGNGTRMNNALPKQFIELNGQPIILHTIQKFITSISKLNIILVLHPTHLENWERICKKFSFNYPIVITNGGETRFHSVKNGLNHVPENALVGIHDAARPLVNNSTILTCFSKAEKDGNASPCIALTESIREIEGENNKAVDRNKLFIIQTPQCFQSTELKKAFIQHYSPSFTDDASVLESIGGKINLVEGNKENIKITTPQDLIIAEALLHKGL